MDVMGLRRGLLMMQEQGEYWDVICLPESDVVPGYLINHRLDVLAGQTVEYEAYCSSAAFNAWNSDERAAGGGIRQFTPKDQVVHVTWTVVSDGYIMVGGGGPDGRPRYAGYGAFGYYIKARIVR